MSTAARTELAARNAAFIRDVATAAARTLARPELFAAHVPTLPMGAPALTTHDLQDCGVEQALNDLLAEEQVTTLGQQLAALTAEFTDFRTRVTDNFVRHAEQASNDRARIRNLESLVQEREREIDALRRRIEAGEEWAVTADDRLDVIEEHNDQIANAVQGGVFATALLTDLAKHAPALLKIAAQGEEQAMLDRVIAREG